MCTSFHPSYLERASEIFCVDGDVEKVAKSIARGENIYQTFSLNQCFVPLSVALLMKNEKLANMFLDIYERDLELLDGTRFKLALIAMSDDQTDEFLNTIEIEPSGDVTPVLLKTKNNETPRCVYLRKKLLDKNDLSLKFTTTLETKNNTCDINWKCLNGDGETFLHIAIYYELKSIVQRLLQHPMIDPSIKVNGETTMNYALRVRNFEIINMLSSVPHFRTFYESQIGLFQAVTFSEPMDLEFFFQEVHGKRKNLRGNPYDSDK